MNNTTSHKLLSQVWKNGKKDNWGRVNHSMVEALRLAIGSGLKFSAENFQEHFPRFRWERWVGASTEWIYTEAIICGNESCWKAYEDWKRRDPYFANEVGLNANGIPYIHAQSVYRKRERLAVGLHFQFDGRRWYVTSFDDSSGVVRVAAYPGDCQRGKPDKLMKLTHDQLSEIFPAPKKYKKMGDTE